MQFKKIQTEELDKKKNKHNIRKFGEKEGAVKYKMASSVSELEPHRATLDELD